MILKTVRNVIAILLCVTGIILLVLPSLPFQAIGRQHGDFVMDGGTLVEYTGHEADLTLPDMISTIGKDSFSGNVSLRNVVIPDSVRTIDFAAFENCTNLQTVYIPESVRIIGSSAFSGCSSLYSVSIPRKVNEIGSGAFAGCTSLSGIPVADDNPNYICQDGVLYSGDGKSIVQYLAGRSATTYAMPASVEKINEYAFWGAKDLTGVAISSKVKEIPEYSFSNCPSLSTIVIPNSVSKIHAYAFSDCVNLRSAVIPTSVGYIDDLAFYMSNGVKVQFVDPSDKLVSEPTVAAVSSAGLSGTADAYADQADGSEDETDPDASGTPDADDSLTSPPQVQIDYEENILPGEMGSTKVVGSQAVLLMSPAMTVKGSYNLNKAELEDGIANSNLKNTSKEDTFSVIRGVLDAYNGEDTNVNVPSDITKIGNRCFYKNDKLEQVTIPDTVSSIGDFAFARSNLKNVDIPDTVTDIGYAAFYHCESLEQVSVPDSVETIELGAFSGTPWLASWQAEQDNDNYLIVGDHILLSYKGEGGNVTIPEGVKKIAPGCFLGNTSITGVSVPPSVTTIGEDAFNGCTNLNTVSLSAGLTDIEDRAFKNTKLSSLSIPPSVESIGLGAFDLSDDAPLETVLLTGTKIPDVSYKPTASRLSAKDLRTLAFNGIDNAIIRDGTDPDSGTLFDPHSLGFRGAVYAMSADQVDGKNTLNLLKATKEPDDYGVVDIDSHVKIGNSEYLMSGVQESAFTPYSDFSSWSNKQLNDIRINGNTSDDLEALLDTVDNAPSVSYTEANAITVNDLRSSSLQSGTKASAVIPGNTDHFNLTISDEHTSEEDLAAAYLNAFGDSDPKNLTMFDMSMTDATGTVPIKKLNTDKMEISMPLPSYLAGSDDLKVVTLNDNGALMTLSCEKTDVNGADGIKFVTGHFSPFAIAHASSMYTYQEEVIMETEEPAEEELMDDAMDLFQIGASYNTLTKTGKVVPVGKIVSLSLLGLGVLLLLWNLKDVFKKKQKPVS